MPEIIEQIRTAGVVGCGGAGFPTYVKASGKAEIVIMNGAECEPLIGSDQWLMETRPDEIVAGLRIMMECCGAKRGILATKSHYHKVVARLGKAIAPYQDLEIFELGNFYPSGDEFILVRECTGRIIPESGIPLHVGVVTNNAETLFNVAQAVKGTPVTEKTVTVAGEVNNPGIFRFPLGTTIPDVLDLAGGTTTENPVFFDGGPMMGRPIHDQNDVVRKTTSALIVLERNDPYFVRRTMPVNFEMQRTIAICCQCFACTELCPRYQLGHDLKPHEVMRAIITKADDPPRQISQAYICCECGVCEVVACPLGLSPRNVFNTVKRELQTKKVSNPHHRVPEEVRHAYPYTKIPKERVLARTGLDRYDRTFSFNGLCRAIRRVELLLKQHIGIAALPIVKPGIKVEKGMTIAKSEGQALCVDLHASISGTVKTVTADRIIIEV